MNWVICSPTYARQNPLLLKQAIVRIFQGLKEILNETPVATPFASLLEEGLHMMDRAVPATKEYVDQNLHPAPRDVAEAQELYDMVVNEKAYFVGKPTPLMLRRWSRNLITIVSMLDGAKMKGTQLYEDSVNLCKSLIDQIQAQAKAQ